MPSILDLIGIIAVASLLLGAVIWGVLRLCGRRPQRYFRRLLAWHLLLLVPLYAFVGVPGFFGWLACQRIGTRGDERAYSGPRIDAEGNWLRQSRDSLEQEEDGKSSPDPVLVDAAQKRAVTLQAEDGVPLRAFLVQPIEAPRFVAILVHGLFRGALELENPGEMLRDLGGAVLLLEMRNHGGSGKAKPTFGPREAQDVAAAAAFVRSQDPLAELPLLLYGVSLGTAAVSLAAPEIPGLDGLVLDAPMISLLEVAHRMLRPRPDSRFGISQPFRSLIFTAMELSAGFRMSEVRPADALTQLPSRLPSLIIGAGQDRRMPPEVVREVYAQLAAAEGTKELWICEEASHGAVWEEDPEGYRQRLNDLVQRILER